MLQFNLSKIDRVVLHQRIAASHITPKEISLMSSTDLANEETKQSIKIAEKEALEHSILQQTKVPRAKITHKGLQDIEDLSGEGTSARDQENEREREEEERRERERTARLKAVQAQQQQRQRTLSVSVPPESPVVPQSASWGAPPPLPVHAIQPGDDLSSARLHYGSARPPVDPLFVHTTSDFQMEEPELNLADLINIDDEPSGQDAPASGSLPASPALQKSPVLGEAAASQSLPSPVPDPAPESPTGISPFANVSKLERVRSMSFDLNSLWSAPKKDVPATPVSLPPQPAKEPKDVIMDSDILGEGADDQDFDMFLDEKDQDVASEKTPEALQAAFYALPPVWSGKVCLLGTFDGLPLNIVVL